MANTVIAVRSSGTAAATPSLGVIANGELSLNFADGILYYKTSSNTLGSIRTTQPAGLTTEVQFNDAGAFGSTSQVTINKTSGEFRATTIKSTQSSGDEGGQLDLATPATNSTLAGGYVNIDIYQNKIRIFEAGGTNRGVFIDLANGAAAGVSTNLISGSATVTSVAGATGAVSNNQILAGLLTVDGAGSGLDADLLDGLSSASFANAAFANTDYTTISATAGVYGNASHIPVTTLTANGRVSSITNTAIAIDAAAITSGTLAVARGGTGVTTSTGTGAVVLNTSPTLATPTVDRIDWPAVGYAPPSLTTRSSGTKLTLYPSLSSTSVDYALGINGGVLWSSIPAANTSYSFKWYGGESEIASLSGSGEFTTITSNVISTTASTSNTTGALKVAGGIGVKGNVSANGIIFDDGTRQTTAASAGASIGDVLALSIALG